MSTLLENIKIGVEEGGEIRLISQINLDRSEYELGENGIVFTGEQGTETIRRLRELNPDKTFVIVR